MTDNATSNIVDSQQQPVGVRAVMLALFISILWAGNPVAVRYSVDTLPPIFVAALRFSLATILMFFWCRAEGSRLRLTSGQTLPCLLAGFGMFVQIATFNVGVTMSSSSHATMLINTFVFWVLIIEHILVRSSRWQLRKFVGVVLAAIGVVLVVTRSSGSTLDAATHDLPTLRGDLILLSSAMILSVKVLFVKSALRTIEPGKLVFWQNLASVAMFFAWSSLTETVDLSKVTMPTLVAIIYQGIFVGGICFAIQAVLLRRHAASQIAVFSFATPLFGVLLAVIFRGDPLTPWLFVATACVAMGILLVNLRPRDGSLID
ncbi:MAG: DMT family transporter [Pirellulaceae bacterium]|jgi:drug/metabolite transporter (DMT)-like permease|nr:DMT family transporter [Pirellulaceae bacterium]MDP6553271.1 DMT family transporter [Pirellulaceae bacterium]